MTIMSRGLVGLGDWAVIPTWPWGESTSRTVPQRGLRPILRKYRYPSPVGRYEAKPRGPDVRATLRQQDAGPGGGRPHPARPVPDREVPGPALRLRAAGRPRDLGLPRLGRGRLAVHAHVGPVQGPAAQVRAHGYPLR